MDNKISLANMALAMAGATVSIVSFEEDTEEANIVSKYYDSALSQALSMHPWSFLKIIASPVLLKEDYTYKYFDIAQFMRVIRVLADDGSGVEFDTVLLNNSNTSESYVKALRVGHADPVTHIEGTVLHHNYPLYGGSFKRAFCSLLASIIAPSLVRGDSGIQLASSLKKTFREDLARAISEDASSRHKKRDKTNHMKNIRGGMRW